MKKKTSPFYLLLLLLISFSATSQQSLNNNLESEYISNKTINLSTLSKDYTGTPYFKETFTKGHIYKNGKLLVANTSLRYNANKDEFEVEKNSNANTGIVNTLFKKPSLSIKFGITEFIFIRPNSTNTAHGYFLLVQKGEKFSYLKKVKKKYVAGKKAYTSMAVDTAPMYKDDDSYYLVNSDEKLVEVPNSKNGIIESFGSHKKELKAFIKKNKINVKKEKGMKKLVEYYNSL